MVFQILAELFPTRLRYSGLSLTYGLASAIFGGTAPALATFLVRRTGAPLSPAWYATGLTVVAMACVLLAPETIGRPWTRAVSERPNRAASTILTRCGWCRSARLLEG